MNTFGYILKSHDSQFNINPQKYQLIGALFNFHVACKCKQIKLYVSFRVHKKNTSTVWLTYINQSEELNNVYQINTGILINVLLLVLWILLSFECL